MTVPFFQSFRSTLTGWVRGLTGDRYHVLEDPITGAPVGLQSNRGNGPQGIFTPVDLTAAQIAAPTAAMIADLNAEYRLNVAPYNRYRSDGTTLIEIVSGGSSTLIGPVTIGPSTTNAVLTVTGLATQPAADTQYLSVVNLATYTGDSASGANLGIASSMLIDMAGNHLSATHSTGVYGNTQLYGTNAASLIDFISGVEGAAGNGGAGTVTRASAFLAHPTYNTGGGTIDEDWALYQETATGAFSNSVSSAGRGFYINASSGIGTNQPGAYLDIRATNELGSTALFKVRSTAGTLFQVAADGTITGTNTTNNPGTTILYAPVTITAAKAPWRVQSTVSVRALPA